MIEAGEQAVWDLGPALVLAERPGSGAIVSVAVIDRDWDGRERSQHYRIVAEGSSWRVEGGDEDGRRGDTLLDLLPVICQGLAPTSLGPIGGASPAF